MALNLLFLALIALVPFSTNLMSDYSEVPEAAAVFGATIGLASLTNWTMVVYTRRRAFVLESTASSSCTLRRAGSGSPSRRSSSCRSRWRTSPPGCRWCSG